MTMIGEVFVCLLQIILFQIIATPIFRKSAYTFALIRNPEWLKDNPETLKQFPAPKGKLHYIIATILMTLTIASMFHPLLNTQRWIINIVSAVAMSLQVFTTHINSFVKLRKIIPQKIKKAMLKKRTVSQILPSNIKIAIVLFALASIALKVILFQSTPLEYKHYFSLDILAILFLVSIVHIVKKQPICHNFEFDYQYRKIEATLTGLVIVFFFISSIIYNLGDLGFISKEIIKNYKSFSGSLPLTMFAIFLLYANPILRSISTAVKDIIPSD